MLQRIMQTHTLCREEPSAYYIFLLKPTKAQFEIGLQESKEEFWAIMLGLSRILWPKKIKYFSVLWQQLSLVYSMHMRLYILNGFKKSLQVLRILLLYCMYMYIHITYYYILDGPVQIAQLPLL